MCRRKGGRVEVGRGGGEVGEEKSKVLEGRLQNAHQMVHVFFEFATYQLERCIKSQRIVRKIVLSVMSLLIILLGA